MRTLLPALLCVACSAVPIAEVPDLDDTAAAATVVLVHGSDQCPKCAAVAVGPHWLVTARHCLLGGRVERYVDREAWAATWSEDTATLLRFGTGGERALALLETDHPLDAWAAPSFGALTKSESICWSHHRGQAPFRWECGRVVSTEFWAESFETSGRTFEAVQMTETDLVGGVGSSGAGLWDRYGRLVGIALGHRPSNSHEVFYHSDAIVALLDPRETGTE